MTYEEFQKSSRFGLEELIAFAYGTLVEDPRKDLRPGCRRRLF